jgi:hypothetical protein
MQQASGAPEKLGFLENLDSFGHGGEVIGVKVGVAPNAPDSMSPQGISPPLQEGTVLQSPGGFG